MKKGRRTLALLLCALLLAGLFGCQIADRALEGAEEFLTGMGEELSGPAENTPAPTDGADDEAEGGEGRTAGPTRMGAMTPRRTWPSIFIPMENCPRTI